MKFSVLSILATSLILSGEVRAAEANHRYALKEFAAGFVSPTVMAPLPGSAGFLVADQVGIIYAIGTDGKRAGKEFLDLRSQLTKLNEGFDERGLLGLALHPDFATNRKFYVVYSAPRRGNAPAEWDHTMRLSEFTAESGALVGKSDSERVMLEIDQPYFNHNAGTILFGPDGYLYFASGDGGNANDQDERNRSKGRPPEGWAQNLQTLLGKILRIDVNEGNPYGVPRDNPFVGKEARPEIWAYGLRNPWRISFDRGGNHELFAGDVGQDAFEEVDIIVKGGNYGWRIKEGFHCFNPADTRRPPKDCPETGANGDRLIDPILEYKNFKAFARDPEAQGISVTGGYVYRGKALPHLQGRYIFADWSRVWFKPEGVVFIATRGNDGKWSWQRINPTHPEQMNFYITAFAEDSEGELYVLTNDTNGLIGESGKVFKIVP